ncbi:flagellar type III secretion system protein FlhB [Chromobacterium phragmitis]|uniref:Flagellar type III secretion system protein FlhB n=1 Tax=Chromobacterium phragmitis TaxID=2202141 RepID=A0A344UEK0_9NEIS|nr:flagellar type III secretion system protein FlhB [Chromobacterium phragmitis]AXE33698.1 flagellar type III secretion system protein FlhB [Chromobacterium phragmitis]
MAEGKQGDKTEKATPQRLRKAREQGQVPRSKDLAAALGLLLALKMMFWLAPGWLDDFRQLFALAFASLSGQGALENSWSKLFGGTLLLLLKMLAPLAVIPAAMLLLSLFPGGWVFVLNQISPKFERMNPLAHLSRLASPKHASEIGKSIAKALILGWLLYRIARDTIGDFFALHSMPLLPTLAGAADLLLTSLLKLSAVFLLFALADLPLQVFLFLKQQKMSKQEIKEEHKNTEGRPEVRQRIRQLQQQMAQRSVRKSLPGADVIIVNPSHYAVALKYDENRAEAPFIVAKGVDEMALFIRQMADELKLTVVPLPPLARAVYHTTQVNQQIPAPLYRAVAQVLTYVLQLKAFQAGDRRSRPILPELSVPRELSDPDPAT